MKEPHWKFPVQGLVDHTDQGNGAVLQSIATPTWTINVSEVTIILFLIYTHWLVSMTLVFHPIRVEIGERRHSHV